jgi:hypothetical protein
MVRRKQVQALLACVALCASVACRENEAAAPTMPAAETPAFSRGISDTSDSPRRSQQTPTSVVDVSSAPPAPYERIAQVMAMQPAGPQLDQIVAILRDDPNAAVREAAVVTLANSEDGRAIDALIAATEDPEPRVALAAIELLSWSEDRQAHARLEALARADDEALARAAGDALAH